MADGVKILVPGDEPAQIGGSPQLERLKPYGEVTLYDTRPQNDEEKRARAQDFDVIINSRGQSPGGKKSCGSCPGCA